MRARTTAQLALALFDSTGAAPLRFAESLDRSHAGNIRHVRFRLKGDAHAVLDIHAVQDCQIELWALQKHVTAFKKMLGCKLDVEVVMQGETADGVRQAD